MQYNVVIARLNDLPAPFIRQQSTYYAWQSTQAAALTAYGISADAIPSQVYFSVASAGWLDVWGELLGFPRQTGEGDVPYKLRIQQSLVAPVGSATAIENFGTTYFNSSVTVVEGFATYTIQLPSFVTAASLSAFLQALARIRPAGVPFITNLAQVGVYYGAFFYYGGPTISGLYPGGSVINSVINLPASTNNSQPLLPSNFLTDPILNGIVSV